MTSEPQPESSSDDLYLEIPPGPPLLIVLSGPSGAGKDAVRDLLMASGLPLYFAVTATTRPMRPGERDGVDYHFLTDAQFDRLEAEDGLLEHALVYGQRKGVPRSEVLDPLAAGRDVVARVDVQGAATLRRLVPHVVVIFLDPPSLDEEERRLDERATESEDEKRLRLEASAAEMAAAADFDYRVVNQTGQLEDTVRRIVEIIAAEKRRISCSRPASNPEGQPSPLTYYQSSTRERDSRSRPAKAGRCRAQPPAAEREGCPSPTFLT